MKPSSYRITLTVGLWLMIITNAFCQNHAFRHYTVNDGLPSSEVYEAFQSSDGMLVFISDRGITKYDGYTFKNYSLQDGLPDNTVFNVTEDHKKRLWFSSISGHIFFEQNDRFHITNPPVKLKVMVDQWKLISQIYVDNNDILWALISGSNNGIVKITDLKNVSDPLIMDSTSRIQLKYIGNGHYMTALNKQAKHYKLKLHSKLTLDISDLILKENLPDIPKGIIEVEESVYLAYNNAVLKVRKKDKSYEIFRSEERTTKCFQLDKNGNLWVGILQKGVIKFDRDDFSNRKLYLKGESVSSMLHDKEDSYWFTTLDNGIFHLPWQELFHFNDAIGGCLTLTCLQSSVSAGFVQGEVVIYQHGQAANLLKLPKKMILTQSLASRNDELFINSSNSIFNYKNGQLHLLKNIPYSRKLVVDRDGDLWALGNGFYKIEDEQLVYSSRNYNFSNWTTSLLKLKDNKYLIGTFDGLWQFDGKESVPLNYDNPILNQRISDIKKMGDHLLISTIGNGILIKSDDHFTHLKKSSNELLSNVINSIYVENDSIFWLATNKGLSRVQISNNGSYSVSNITKEDNLLSDEIHQILLKDNYLWVATNNGLLKFEKDLFDYDEYSIPVLLKYIHVNGKPLNPDKAAYLGYDKNNLDFGYVALFYKNTDKLNYRYRLKPTDNWTYTKNTSVQLINLSQGQYQLELEASINGSTWFSIDKNPKFVIEPPFWQTWLFQLIVIMIIAILLWLIFAHQLKSLKKKAYLKRQAIASEHKALKAQLNPHFLFNSLNAINSSILDNDKFTASNYLAKFSRLMRLTLNNSIETSITLKKEMDTLSLYLEMEALRMDNKFSFNISHAADIKPERYLVPAMLVQPFAENAIWHGLSNLKGEHPLLNVHFERHDHAAIRCTIEDNGIGRTAAQKIKRRKNTIHQSHGITIIENRLKILGQLNSKDYPISIHDKVLSDGKAAGTVVKLTIPLTQTENDQGNLN